ncbi:MAG: FIST N-terminal domain-containing protein [Phycisphaerales bacterium JB039]
MAQLTSSQIVMGSGLSGAADAAAATRQACAEAQAGLGEVRPNIAFLFYCGPHAASAAAIAEAARDALSGALTIGAPAESIVGGRVELERGPGVSVLAARLDGVRTHAFDASSLLPLSTPEAERKDVAAAIGADGDDHRATLLFADALSFPVASLLPAINRALADRRGAGAAGPVFGGLASGAERRGQRSFILDGRLVRAGVGLTLSGAVSVDTVVSQGCRPLGPNMVVTGARDNLIVSLGGRRALDAIREIVDAAPESDRRLLRRGMCVGRVINEYKERFGRDDYLMRNIVGADEDTGAVATSDFFRVGQTVRLHLRDADTAHEDLELLLDGQALHARPAGGLLVTCASRGQRLFREPSHDAETIMRAFDGSRARAPAVGAAPRLGPMPMAGMFGAGEIAPLGSQSYVHGHTACLALFRAPRREP